MLLHLLNTTIIPAGSGRLNVGIEELTVEEARELLAENAWVSHVGHESTAHEGCIEQCRSKRSICKMKVKSAVRVGGIWYNTDGPCAAPCICERPRMIR